MKTKPIKSFRHHKQFASKTKLSNLTDLSPELNGMHVLHGYHDGYAGEPAGASSLKIAWFVNKFPDCILYTWEAFKQVLEVKEELDDCKHPYLMIYHTDQHMWRFSLLMQNPLK